MQEVAIVTDSATDITGDLSEELGVLIAPLHAIIGDEDYRHRVDISPEEFYTRLPTLPALPTSAGVNVADCLACYHQALERGMKSIICIVPTETLSISLSSARVARELRLDEIPETDITVVNSHTAVTPQALMVIAAARAAREGEGEEQILSLVEGLIPRVDVFFALQTIEYLDKGGSACGHRAGSGIRTGSKTHRTDQGRSHDAGGQG